MLQRDPIKQSINRRIGWFFIVFPILILLELVFNIFQYITSTSAHRNISLIPIVILPVSIICFIFAWLLFRRTWRLRAQKRALALKGDQRLLAAEQPTPDPNSLTLPTTLELRIKPTIYYILTGYVILVFAIMAFVLLLLLPFNATQRLIFLLATAAFLVIVLIAMRIAAYFGMRLNRQYITVTDEGITTRHLNKITTIPWHEARFFSINGIAKQNRAVIYELSSDTATSLWTRLLVSKGFIRTATLRPTIPFPEYEQQSQALISLIAARTRLPLYDLRDTTNKWYT